MPGLMRITHQLVGLVFCGTALMAACTLVNCPLPSAATTSSVSRLRARGGEREQAQRQAQDSRD